MNALIFLTVVTLLWVAREVFVSIASLRSRIRYEHLRKIEQTQGNFAEVRNELMRLAVSGEANARTDTFREIYQLNTAFMRRPDEYVDMSNALRRFMMSNEETPSGKTAIERESGQIDDATKKVALMTADALSHIVVDYSFILRNGYRYIRRSDPGLTKTEFVREISRDLRKPKVQQKRFERDINLAQSRLRQMAMA